MTKTITLSDMAIVAQERVDWLMHSAAHMRERAQEASDAADLELHRTYIRWAETDEHKAACFSALATLARQLAIDPDKSRQFVKELIGEYGRG